MLAIHGRWLALIMLPLCLMWPHPATCSEPVADSIQQMNHRTWMVVNGAPPDNWDIKQDGKGFIWLATGTGLFRFDGVQFERYVPAAGQAFPSIDMTALHIVSDEDFWVGTSDGVISHIREGRVVSYPISNAAKEGPVYEFAVTPDGAMWVVAGRALLRYSDGKLAKVGADWEFPPDMQAMWMLVDKAGTAWLATDRELLFLRKGSHRFERTGIPTGLYSVLALSPDGTLWVSDGVHGTRALPGLSAGHIPRQLLKPLPVTHFAQSMRMAFDKSGALWGTLSYRSGLQGIFRVPNPSQLADGQPLRPEQVTDRYSTQQGFTSIVTVPILVDREGDVWVGTDFGLNRFHTNSFKVVSPLPGASPVEAWLSPDNAGKVLLLQKGCLYRVSHTVASEVTCAFPANSYHIFTAGDRYLSVTPAGFYQWSPQTGGSPLKLPGNQASWDTTAVGRDVHGNLWLGFSGSLYELAGSAWRKIELGNTLGSKQPTAIAFDAGNTMWLGYSNGHILRWNGRAAVVYTASDGLSIGNVEAIAAQSGSILVGGDTGVARWKNGRFQSLSAARLPVLSAVSGVAETKTGDLWLNTSVGVVRIEANEAERAFDDTGYTPNYRLYGSDDGVPGIAFRQPLASTITKDEDGRLWFLTNQGVCWIDPSTVHANPVAPQTIIESIVAEGRPFPIDSRLALPPHTSTISFRYTAASLRAPQNVKFRYKLSGVDTHWQDGGTQRQAVYANLKPGDYAFQVEAANSDGVWSEHPSSLAFQIERTFYQTRIFQILSIMAAILGVVALAFLERRRMLRALRDRLEVRHAERERIARELHDTLLQGVQGLTLCIQAFADRIPKGDPFRAKVEQSLERAYELLVDGRDRVRDLRTRDHAAKDLAEAFTSLANDLVEEWPARCRIECGGMEQAIIPVIREEIYLIGREALLNAFQHANAAEIDVTIAYDIKQLHVCIRDDGVGIDPQTLDAGHRPGHWGLVGMRERTNAIGGRLLIRASAGAGTEIELVVPAGIAYAHPRQSNWAWFKRLRPSSWRDFPNAVQANPKYPMS